MKHIYMSTACQHGLHDRCRKQCKFCEAKCSCSCHKGGDANCQNQSVEPATSPDVKRGHESLGSNPAPSVAKGGAEIWEVGGADHLYFSPSILRNGQQVGVADEPFTEWIVAAMNALHIRQARADLKAELVALRETSAKLVEALEKIASMSDFLDTVRQAPAIASAVLAVPRRKRSSRKLPSGS